jgi:hypothetical protein
MIVFKAPPQSFILSVAEWAWYVQYGFRNIDISFAQNTNRLRNAMSERFFMTGIMNFSYKYKKIQQVPVRARNQEEGSGAPPAK